MRSAAMAGKQGYRGENLTVLAVPKNDGRTKKNKEQKKQTGKETNQKRFIANKCQADNW